ncbi:MAG: hypothetical protein V2B19_07175 [Pseudomonadota bacterium]
MEKDTEFKIEHVSFSSTTSNELRGRQSIRATFKLTAGCIDAISIVAKHLGIKQKSLFDHLAEDTQILKKIAREASDAQFKSQERVQKTFVISRRSLQSIESISKLFNAPRDVLVEYSVQRLLPIIAAEREKHEKRKELITQLQHHFTAGLALHEKIKTEIGVDDPIFSWMASVVHYYHNALDQMTDFVDKGKIIEDFDPESLGLPRQKP